MEENLDGAVAVFEVGWQGQSLGGVEAMYTWGLGWGRGKGRLGWERGRGESAGETGSLEIERLI